MLMVPNVLKVLAVDTQCLLIVRVDLAQLVPEEIGLLSCFVNFLP